MTHCDVWTLAVKLPLLCAKADVLNKASAIMARPLNATLVIQGFFVDICMVIGCSPRFSGTGC